MNKVILQRWVESDKNIGIQPDGCSLHLCYHNMITYIKEIYKDRTDDIPDVYERLIGNPISAFIDDPLYDILKQEKNFRLRENELNNLIKLEELIIKI